MMFWLYILFLIVAVITAPVWVRYGLKAHDSLILGVGILQAFLAIIWTLLTIYA